MYGVDCGVDKLIIQLHLKLSAWCFSLSVAILKREKTKKERRKPKNERNNKPGEPVIVRIRSFSFLRKVVFIFL